MAKRKDYVAYCLICDKELGESEVAKHSEWLCLDDFGNLRGSK